MLNNLMSVAKREAMQRNAHLGPCDAAWAAVQKDEVGWLYTSLRMYILDFTLGRGKWVETGG